MNKKIPKKFFLISFIPAIAYWYLEEHYPLKVALSGGIILAVIEVIFEKVYTKHVHTLSKFNFFLIVFLGSISFLGNDGFWFKMQPCLTGVGISSFLLFRLWRGKGLLFEMMASINPEKCPPEFIIASMEKHLSILFFTYGSFMGFVAYSLTTKQWLFFKTAGFYTVFSFFMIVEFFLMRMAFKKHLEKQHNFRTMMEHQRRK